MSERKFSKGLNKPGMAAQLREQVSSVVRESHNLSKPQLVEPIDFEDFLIKNKFLIQNDPQRELLMYPNDDVSEIILPRRFRTIDNNIPKFINNHSESVKTTTSNGNGVTKNGEQKNGDHNQNGHHNDLSRKKSDTGSSSSSSSTTSTLTLTTTNGDATGNNRPRSPINASSSTLLTRQALHTYQSNNHLIHYKYSAYGGSCRDLPRTTPLSASEILREEVYEIDADQERIGEQMSKSQAASITKQGYLHMWPEAGLLGDIAYSRRKRRYCDLRQEIDGTYILEVHKDEKKTSDAKSTIVMDFCTEIVKKSKRGRLCFELKLSTEPKPFIFSVDNEDEKNDWINKLLSVLEQNQIREEVTEPSICESKLDVPVTDEKNSPSWTYGTLKGLDQSMNPQLIKYGRETLFSIAEARTEDRKKLFAGYKTLYHKPVIGSPTLPQLDHIEPYKEEFGKRLVIKCKSLKFKLQNSLLNPNDEEKQEEPLCQIEPYLTSLALYDAKAGRKLTENFYFDLNQQHVKDMIPGSENGLGELPPELSKISHKWFESPSQSIFNLTNCHSDIYLVVKIDKVLQGGINPSSEPYLKACGKDPKHIVKFHKTIKSYCQKIGHYRMPFAWTAKPLFRQYRNDLEEIKLEFTNLYRQENNRMKDEELLKFLVEFRKPEKLSKLTVIPGCLKVELEEIVEVPNNTLSTTLCPLKPFPLPPTSKLTFEITEFQGASEREVHPFTTFVNHFYVYPMSLIFDSQKLFSRARNITVIVELRENDNENAEGLNCIYGRPGQTLFVKEIATPVLHHSTCPTWYEEIKIRLPLHLTPQHHLLFSFLHVSCNLTKKRDANASFETPVGYAWLPLLNKGKINLDEQCLPVAAVLPTGYLSIQPLGLGKGNSGPEIQWIDNQRPLFTVGFRLNSTVLSPDQHLHNLFAHAEKLLESPKMSVVPAESETCKILKAAHAIQISSLISFLPTILNQLFTLLVNTTSEEIGLNVIRLLINIIHLLTEAADRKDLLLSYVKFVFHSPNFTAKQKTNTVHGELCRHLPTILHPNNTDFLIVNKFMKYSSIFFDIIVKSMAQHLLDSGRIKMHRNERFPKEFHDKIESLFKVFVPYLIHKYKDLPEETQELNKSICHFIKRSLTLMDRGFVFKMVRFYLMYFGPGDSRVLHEFKFQFLRELCYHEHYIPLNMPFAVNPKKQKRRNVLIQHFTLSEEFCREHYIAGLLLLEVKTGLNEVSNIRKMALGTLREMIAKHDLDDRYQNKGQLSRIALLYIPWMTVVLENIHRIPDGTEVCKVNNHDNASLIHRMSTSSSFIFPTPTNSTPNKVKNRQTLHIEHPSPLRSSMHVRDSSYFAAIAGQIGHTNGASTCSLNSFSSDMSQEHHTLNGDGDAVHMRNGHIRSISSAIPRTDKFTPSETRDMLIVFLYVLKNMTQDQMYIWWDNCSDSEINAFMVILEICLYHFRYVGKNNLVTSDSKDFSRQIKNSKASTLPARMVPPTMENGGETNGTGTLNLTSNQRENLADEAVKNNQALYESNLATEVGMIILDVLGWFSLKFHNAYTSVRCDPNDTLKLGSVYLKFLQHGQSENLSKHVFAAIRSFINNFSLGIFKGHAVLCGQIVYELLKACDSHLVAIRHEACAVLYLLMRTNFEFSKRKGLTRVHLQVIISVSQMIGNVIGLNNARFQESLSMINTYAFSDKAMKGTGFPNEVKDLTRRVRTVLMATAQMQAHHHNEVKLLELQYSLANSYASTPELRHTWLLTMARNHEQNGNISEAAMCYLHICALMAEYLKLKGTIKWGAEAFKGISPNIARDEKGLKLDSGAQDSQYTEQMLLDQLKQCADFLDKSERFECLGELYRLIVPIYEKRRDYYSLMNSYQHLGQVYNKIIEVNRSGRRMLGRFYRVVFYGQAYFEEDHGIEYVYKEPKLTTLSEISERLFKQYKDKFGNDLVKMIMDSSPVNVKDLDPKIAYIQVTHVTPYFCKDELDNRQNEFEQNHDVDRFVFERPYFEGPSPSGKVEDQWKAKTIIRTSYSFPYVLKRIPVKESQNSVLTPIEVAIEEMQNKVTELQDVILPPADVKKLQLRLQGSIAATVHSGPFAYAKAFLDPKNKDKIIDELRIVKIEDLKQIFRDFMEVSWTALKINERLISSDQKEYHSALHDNYIKLSRELGELLNETFLPVGEDLDADESHRNSLALFNAISGAANNSSTA